MKKHLLAKWLLAIGTLIVMQHPAIAADELLLRAKKLVDAKKPAQAYALLAPLQSERAGEVEYDYLLGIAALDSGKPAEALFALERVLANNPNNGPARLEVARAHYMMGDAKAAKAEFDTVKQQHPPGQVNEAIQKYLGAIDQMGGNDRTTYRGYVEVGIGRDNNANSATSSSQVAIPFFGGVIATLSPGSTSTRDSLLLASAGINVRHPFSADWALNANASIGQRKYAHVSQYDIGNLDASLGLTRTIGIDQFTGGVQYQKILVDRDAFRQTYGLLGQWQRNIDDMSQVTAYGQYMRQSYDGTQQIRDVNRYLLGTAYSQGFSIRFFPIVYAGLYAGKETPHANNVPQLDNDFAGLRLGGRLMLWPSTTLSASASYETRRYNGADPLFMLNRKDFQTDYSLALNYTPLASWTIRPEISHTRNRSNLILNDYSRTQYSVSVRYDF